MFNPSRVNRFRGCSFIWQTWSATSSLTSRASLFPADSCMANHSEDKTLPEVVWDDHEQAARFIEAARKLGIEQVGEAYERALKRILAAPRPSEPAPAQTAEPEPKKRTRGRPKNPA